MKSIVYSDHAENKFVILAAHGSIVSRETVESALRNPDRLEPGYRGRQIAQSVIDKRHVIRVIYEELPEVMRVITFYPAKKERYENQLQ